MATMASRSISSRQASMSFFSVNGSPPPPVRGFLFWDRLADLHGGALLPGRVIKSRRRQQAGAVDAVAAGLRADVDDGVADAGGASAGDAIGADQPARDSAA